MIHIDPAIFSGKLKSDVKAYHKLIEEKLTTNCYFLAESFYYPLYQLLDAMSQKLETQSPLKCYLSLKALENLNIAVQICFNQNEFKLGVTYFEKALNSLYSIESVDSKTAVQKEILMYGFKKSKKLYEDARNAHPNKHAQSIDEHQIANLDRGLRWYRNFSSLYAVTRGDNPYAKWAFQQIVKLTKKLNDGQEQTASSFPSLADKVAQARSEHAYEQGSKRAHLFGHRRSESDDMISTYCEPARYEGCGLSVRRSIAKLFQQYPKHSFDNDFTFTDETEHSKVKIAYLSQNHLAVKTVIHGEDSLYSANSHGVEYKKQCDALSSYRISDKDRAENRGYIYATVYLKLSNDTWLELNAYLTHLNLPLLIRGNSDKMWLDYCETCDTSILHSPPESLAAGLETLSQYWAVIFSDNTPSGEELETNVARFHYLFANLCPYFRGSAAIAEILTRACYQHFGYLLQSTRFDLTHDLLILSSLHMKDFLSSYHQSWVISPTAVRVENFSLPTMPCLGVSTENLVVPRSQAVALPNHLPFSMLQSGQAASCQLYSVKNHAQSVLSYLQSVKIHLRKIEKFNANQIRTLMQRIHALFTKGDSQKLSPVCNKYFKDPDWQYIWADFLPQFEDESKDIFTIAGSLASFIIECKAFQTGNQQVGLILASIILAQHGYQLPQIKFESVEHANRILISPEGVTQILKDQFSPPIMQIFKDTNLADQSLNCAGSSADEAATSFSQGIKL